MNTREKVLKEALNCVNGEREKQYGNPEDNFRRIADLWSVYLTSLFEDEKIVVDIDPIDVAKMMILFKIARSNGDKDKMDNYVDMIGYAACAAEIFEGQEKRIEVSSWDHIKVAEECRVCNYREKCMGTGVCLKEEEKELQAKKNPYSYVHDKLSNYVSVKAKEALVPLGYLKTINHKFPRELSNYLAQASKDCVETNKSLLACYKEIDDLFVKHKELSPYFVKGKYGSFWQTYNNISAHIALESSKANVNPIDVVEQLIKKGNAPIDMADLLQDGKLNFDDIASYVEHTINELKRKDKK